MAQTLAPSTASHATVFGTDPVCALYRFVLPLRAMIARSWTSAAMHMLGDGSVTLHPRSSLLVQRHIALSAEHIAHVRKLDCRLVHDIDDLLWCIPADNPNRDALTPDMLGEMFRAMHAADLVTTTTEPLAAALSLRGLDAVVVPNLLDPADWTVTPARAERARLRVGWYGQQNVHIEDLSVIDAVVRALAGEVDFVFFGDVPHALAAMQERFEVYAPTIIELFPAMLAALDLDILLSPLARNAFNECKSNLRLLQAGMLGYAVIATDIEPHRTLPVTLVSNTPAHWIAALRSRIGAIDAVRAEGRALQAAVAARYLIDESRARQIYGTWTGRAPALAANEVIASAA